MKRTGMYLINCQLSMCSLRVQLCLVGAKKLPVLPVRELMGGAKAERTQTGSHMTSHSTSSVHRRGCGDKPLPRSAITDGVPGRVRWSGPSSGD